MRINRNSVRIWVDDEKEAIKSSLEQLGSGTIVPEDLLSKLEEILDEEK